MKFLFANFFIFVALASAIFYQVTTVDKVVEQVKVVREAASERTPASINPKMSLEVPTTQEKSNLPNVKKEISKNLDCSGSESEIKTSEELIVISGANCGKFKNIKITNLSNGFTASVFELGEKQYKTDLIPLTIGANKISVEYQIIARKQHTLEKKTEFTIHRQ